MTTSNRTTKQSITRHSLTVRVIHWTVTLSTFVLVFTGIGQMPVYRRYFVDQLPGLNWSSDFSVTLIMHYLAAIALVVAAVYHLVYHGLCKDFNIIPRRGDIKESYRIIKAMLTGSKEPPCHKYLAEQRLAYIFIALSLGLTIVTGMIKVIKNYPSVYFSDGFLNVITLLHNVGTFLIIFGVLAHLFAFVFKENRNLLPSMFHGGISLDYVRHRHSLWYQEICAQGSTKPHGGCQVCLASDRGRE